MQVDCIILLDVHISHDDVGVGDILNLRLILVVILLDFEVLLHPFKKRRLLLIVSCPRERGYRLDLSRRYPISS